MGFDQVTSKYRISRKLLIKNNFFRKKGVAHGRGTLICK